MTDEDISSSLGVSVSTVRLDRSMLAIPQVRERTRRMAERAAKRLRSLRSDEVVGELVELELDRGALSILDVTPEMAFRRTDRAGDYYIYAQATSLAIASINAEFVVAAAARLKYTSPAHLGEKIIARAKVGTHKGNKYVVSVHSRIGDREIFVGRFVVAALGAENSENKEGDEICL